MNSRIVAIVVVLVGVVFLAAGTDGVGATDYPASEESFPVESGIMQPAATLAGITTRVSVASDGTQGNGGSWLASISADGRYVAFESWASNLVAGDTNGRDIFVHDRQTGQTTRVSVASGGVQGNGESRSPSISADGRYVAFASYANNLVPDDTNDRSDVFVHDRWTGQTTRVSVASDGTQGNLYTGQPSISADGRYVAFGSDASNLVPGDTNGLSRDIFVHDRQTGQTSRVSVASDGTQGNSSSEFPSISADSRFVAFGSHSDNLAPGDTNNTADVFVHDRQTGQTTRVSVASDGTQGNGQSEFPSISANGRYVAFISRSDNLVPGDTNGWDDVFVHDRQTGATTRISVSSSGAQANHTGNLWRASISVDGRYVAFYSGADNLAPGDTNGVYDVFVHDRQTGQTTRVSVASDGAQGNDWSREPSISADGRYVAFDSWASNLVPGDTNGWYDIFVHDREGSSGATYSISGRITDSAGGSIAGALINYGSDAATTDGSGNFTISGLVAGTYTLTPSKAGYTFSPASRTVTVGPSKTGQDFVGIPDAAADTDGDGLPDVWEIHGYDHNGDGVVDVDLPAMGADPFRKDVFVEIDYMEESGTCLIGTHLCIGGHSHRPNREAIERTVQAFAEAPVMNPDDSLGITLHVDYGPNSVMNPLTGAKWAERSQSTALTHQDQLGTLIQWTTGNWWSFDEIRDVNFRPEREPIFHYALFVHHLGGLECFSGISRGIPASDFVISLGGWGDGKCGTTEEDPRGTGTTKQQAGTFMHELGHNLGLHHGGNDDVNYKPNYISVMNYAYQTGGIIFNGHDTYLDYSAFGPITLNENTLDETAGLNIGGYGVRYFCNGLEDLQIDTSSNSVNWNCVNGLETNVQANINGDTNASGQPLFSTLSNHNDWANLVFNGGRIGYSAATNLLLSPVDIPFIDELTEQESLQIPSLFEVSVVLAESRWEEQLPRAVYTFRVTNEGSVHDEYDIELTSSRGWTYSSSVPGSISLAPGESASIMVTLSVTEAVGSEIIDQLTLVARSRTDINLSDSANALTTVKREVNMSRNFLPFMTR